MTSKYYIFFRLFEYFQTNSGGKGSSSAILSHIKNPPKKAFGVMASFHEDLAAYGKARSMLFLLSNNKLTVLLFQCDMQAAWCLFGLNSQCKDNMYIL